MKYLLDTNILIALARGDHPRLLERLAACDEGDPVTSAIVFAEVVHGSLRGLPPDPTALEALVAMVPVLDFDRSAAEAYGELRFKRASYDRLIAAHALARSLVVVTDNRVDFEGIPGLRVENWMASE